MAEALTTRVGGKYDEGVRAAEDGPSHFQNSFAAIEKNQSIWKADLENASAQMHSFVEPGALNDILGAARTSQRREHKYGGQIDNDIHDPTLRRLLAVSVRDVQEWLEKKKLQRDENGKLVVNARQLQALKKVADRIVKELRSAAKGELDFGEPLRWLIHGGPGTGKSHVIKQVKELFQDVLRWNMGVEYQVVALQAVMADLLGGDTIHHACGIAVFKKQGCEENQAQRQLDVAKRVLQWRWLIIDEISMVSAKLFAELDVKLRSAIRQTGTQKQDSKLIDRPFGGLNVLCCGDFWQLAPPEGGFLAAIPTDFIQAGRKYKPAPTIAHGQALLWSGPENGIQGVTELIECERCTDAWLKEVQEELRHGRLSDNNHKFLHGLSTTVPGSWVNGDVECGREACRNLATAYLDEPLKQLAKKRKLATDPNVILANECEVCRNERASKARVAQTSDAFRAESFAMAPAIFANNDVKYDANKSRAQRYANEHNLAVTYVSAKDTPSHDAIREKPGIAADKLAWLQRHDRETGDLYGVFPLIQGMPVALTDHIDRNPEKQLLRGKIGYVHSWVLHGEETSTFHQGARILNKLPKVVFVKFSDAEWTLPGLVEKGLYPICPRRSSWFLDKSRKVPMLRISRQQIPLSPAFAITAHSSQGQTMRAAIVDLQIGKETSPIASYVAMTRVRQRSDVLIYRPFDRNLFTRGSPEGPDLLLKTLRGEFVDWKKIEEKYTPHRQCSLCGFQVFKQGFTALQFNRKDQSHCCISCVSRMQEAGTPYECMQCHCWKGEGSFAVADLTKRIHRICADCVEMRSCRSCGKSKPSTQFTVGEWLHAGWPGSSRGVCKACRTYNQDMKKCSLCLVRKERTQVSPWYWKNGGTDLRCLACMRNPVDAWKCVACKETLPKTEFSEWLAGRKVKKNDGKARCNVCKRTAQAEQRRVARDSAKFIQKM